MSVQKLISNSCYTKISNDAIRGLMKVDMQAGFLYVYMQSMPENWKFYKKQLTESLGISLKKLNKLLSILHSQNLIEYKMQRNLLGQYVERDIHVKNGEVDLSTISVDNFIHPENKNELKPNKISTSFHTPQKPSCGDTDAVENPHNGECHTIKEIIINKKIEERERGSLFNFFPDESNVKLADRLNVNVNVELKSFEKRHRGEKTQYEFERWIKSAHEYRQRKGRNNDYFHDEVNSEKRHFMSNMKFADEIEKEEIEVASPETVSHYLSSIKQMLSGKRS